MINCFFSLLIYFLNSIAKVNIKIRYIKQGKPIEEDVECNFDNISNKENMILEFNQSSNTWMPNWNK